LEAFFQRKGEDLFFELIERLAHDAAEDSPGRSFVQMRGVSGYGVGFS
jgi:hypothetical protein